MQLSELPCEELRFRSASDVEDEIRSTCASNPDLASFHVIGHSRNGRPLHGVVLGTGPEVVTLVAGAHADEPVGPETLRILITETLAHRDWLARDGGFAALFERFTFRIIPQINPDGEARNQPWIERWPDVAAYIRHRVRELPGDDIEFGYPVMRPENRAASTFLFDYRPIALHVSLHGMGFAEGALLLIERHWARRVEKLKEAWRSAVTEARLGLHDHDRGCDKGFRYFGPGFWSTPEGAAMRRHFQALGDERTAALIHHSSMEWARLTGYHSETDRHPLSLVTELPLFVIGASYDPSPGVPLAYLEMSALLPELVGKTDAEISAALAPFVLRPLALETAVRLQLRAIELGLLSLARQNDT